MIDILADLLAQNEQMHQTLLRLSLNHSIDRQKSQRQQINAADESDQRNTRSQRKTLRKIDIKLSRQTTPNQITDLQEIQENKRSKYSRISRQLELGIPPARKSRQLTRLSELEEPVIKRRRIVSPNIQMVKTQENLIEQLASNEQAFTEELWIEISDEHVINESKNTKQKEIIQAEVPTVKQSKIKFRSIQPSTQIRSIHNQKEQIYDGPEWIEKGSLDKSIKNSRQPERALESLLQVVKHIVHSCEECDQEFKSFNNLQKHKNECHTIELILF